MQFNPFLAKDEECIAVGSLPEEGGWSVDGEFLSLRLDVAFGWWDEVGFAGEVGGGQGKGDA